MRKFGAAKNTITRLLVDIGKACAEYQNNGVLSASVHEPFFLI